MQATKLRPMNLDSHRQSITGNQIRAARILAGMKQSELAEKARIQRNTLSVIEQAGPEPVRWHAATQANLIRALLERGVDPYKMQAALLTSSPWEAA